MYRKLLFIAVFGLMSFSAVAQGTEFTYQGSLKDTNGTLSGSFDFEFRLYTAPPPDGTLVGSLLTRSGVMVENGVFSVKLDFGNQFPGAARYLEISIRPAGVGTFQQLLPRTLINSIPYSVKSLSTETATNALQLGGVAANEYVTVASGGTNFIKNSTSPQASSNFNISGNGTVGGTLSGNLVQADTQFNFGNERIIGVPNLNLAVGLFAGAAGGVGGGNSFFGLRAGEATTGADNSMFGNFTGIANSSGGSNAFFGSRAGQASTTGSSNTFIGVRAGESNIGGSNNTMLGFNANVLSNNLSFATAIGAGATINRSDQIVLGRSAGQDEVIIKGPTTVSNSLTASSMFTSSLGVGTVTPSAELHVAGNGLVTGNLTVNGSFNANSLSISGTLAGGIVSAGTQFNIGGNRILSTPGGTSLVAGIQSGQANTGAGNAFFGYATGTNNTTGTFNSFFGGSQLLSQGTGFVNTTGSFNSFFGHRAGESSNGNLNSFFGTGAGFINSTGSSNTFIGHDAGNTNTMGSFNTTLGENADVGANNLTNATAIGAKAIVTQSNALILGSTNGVNGATADTNVGIGVTGPFTNTRLTVVDWGTPTGSRMAIFASAQEGDSTTIGIWGDAQGSGDNRGVYGTARNGTANWAGYFAGNTYVGGNLGVGTLAPASRLHVSNGDFVPMAITLTNSFNAPGRRGYRLAFQDSRFSFQSADDSGNFVADQVIIDPATGNVGIGNVSPSDKLNVNGNVSLLLASGGSTNVCHSPTNFRLSTCSSSIRYKQNVNQFSAGLDLIHRLRPVTFHWKADNKEDLGLIAEEVAEVEPLLVTHNEKGEVEGVKYDRVGVVLINAIKQQQAEIEALRKQVSDFEDLKKEVAELRMFLCAKSAEAAVCKKKE